MQSNEYRINSTRLFSVLEDWDRSLRTKILAVACGGTALTLKGYKESTKDIDLLIPDPNHHKALIQTLQRLGYKQATQYGWKHPDNTFIFDLFPGSQIYCTALLDSPHLPSMHTLIRKFKYFQLGVLNSYDLIISKMFRGSGVDVQDCLCLLRAEKNDLDLLHLTRRYIDTAGYDTNPEKCKKNFKYFLEEMNREDFDTTKATKELEKWIP
jgi:hypothetical protein